MFILATQIQLLLYRLEAHVFVESVDGVTVVHRQLRPRNQTQELMDNHSVFCCTGTGGVQQSTGI